MGSSEERVVAVIMVGGPTKGTRFRPLSLNIPKPLFPLAGQPMVNHPLSACKRGSALMGMETFGNLRRLEICASYMPRVDLLALTPYLESCPLLEELILNLGCMDYNVDVERKPVVVFHTKLKKVELSGFNGADNEIEFALYILKTALALDQMFIISCRRVYDEGGWKWYTNKKPWTKQTRKNIDQSLQHQALSNTAKLIIRHQS